MKKIILFSLLITSLSSAFASSKNCTNEPKEKWMKVEDFKAKIRDKGFTINKFKQPGSCYEIYGIDKDGRKIEAYFNPVDASISKIEFAD
jgi:hypothetical protein